jgi:hypothetical protein
MEAAADGEGAGKMWPGEKERVSTQKGDALFLPLRLSLNKSERHMLATPTAVLQGHRIATTCFHKIEPSLEESGSSKTWLTHNMLS